MSDVTKILTQLAAGDSNSAEQLLPLVYGELKTLAARRMAEEKAGHTLQATALVHEAYLRLVDKPLQQQWDSRGHFFSAAAQAMRRILIESARRKNTQKAGGDWHRVVLRDDSSGKLVTPERLLAMDEALERLTTHDAQAAQLVEQVLFAGLSVEDAGRALGISRATAYRH